jgi:peptide/nickel transport system substrate-binding protein
MTERSASVSIGRRRFLGLLGAGAVAAGSAARPRRAAAQPRRGGTLVAGTEGELPNLIAAQATGGPGRRALLHMMEGLVLRDPKTMADRPGLAESWEVSPDARVFTFKLRKGVKFHDGTPFDAEAVRFNIEMVWEASHPFHDPVGAGLARPRFGTLEKIEVLDPHVIRVTHRRSQAMFITWLSDPLSMLVSPAAVKKHGVRGLSNQPVGTGPYRLVEWVRDSKLVMERNPDYWGEGAHLDRVILRPIPEGTARLLALKSGEVDWIADVPADGVAELRTNPAFEVTTGTVGAGLWTFVFNVKEPPFNDKRVRQAANHAINREAFCRDLTRGTGTPATQSMPPGSPEYDPALIKGYAYDPARAKQLLAEAGYASGFKTVWYRPTAVLGPTVYAEFLQRNLADVGIQVEYRNLDPGPYVAFVRQGLQAGVGAANWRQSGDLISMERRYSSKMLAPAGYNYGGYTNPTVDELLDRIQATVDPRQRSALFKEVDRVVVEEAPLLYVFHQGFTVGFSKKVEGYTTTGLTEYSGFFKGVSLRA